jgi:CheY-like chemotaxis protein
MESAPTSQRGVILAVDDEDEDIELMRLLFRKAGVKRPIDVYRTGEDLVAALTQAIANGTTAELPLLCFLDVKMPSMNGHELLKWIRSHRELDHVSVVMLSSSEHPADVKEAAKSGAQCYLAKYPQPSVLKSVIAEAERMTANNPSQEWFGLPANLLLRWGLTKERN